MGATQTSEKFILDFNSQCTKLKEMKDLRFGDVQIYRQNSKNNLILVKSIWCNNESEYNLCLTHCQKRSQIKHPNLVTLLGYHSNSQNQWCGDFSKFSVYLEYFNYTLEQSIESRKQTNQYFTEPELWKLLLTITKLALFLDERNLRLGDLRPSNIQLEKDIKIAEQGIIPQDLTPFQRANFNHEIIYLAPEVLCFLNQQIDQDPPLTEKADIFSLGVTLLETSTLLSGKTIYRGFKIDQQALHAMQEQVKSMYSQMWYRMIRELLHESPDERPSFQDIYDALAGFEDDIVNLKPFAQQTTPIQTPYQYQPPQQQQQPQFTNQQNILPYQQQQQLPLSQLKQQQLPSTQFPQSSLPQQPQLPQSQFPQSSLPQQQGLQQNQPQQQQSITQQQHIQQQNQYQQQQQQYQQHTIQQQQSQQYEQQSYQQSQQYAQYYQQSTQQIPQTQSVMHQPQQSVLLNSFPQSNLPPPLVKSIPSARPIYQDQEYQQEYYNFQMNQSAQSPYHTLQSPQPYMQGDDEGLSEIDRKIQNALKMTRETELRNKQLPNYN